MKTPRFLLSLAISTLTVTGLRAGGTGANIAAVNVGTTGVTGSAHVSAAPVSRAPVSNHGGAVPAPRPTGISVSRPVATGNPGISRPAMLPRNITINPARVTPPTAPAARARNAWTDVAVDNRTPGTHIYPDPTHNALGNPYPSPDRNVNGGASREHHRHPFRLRGRGYYGPYVYGYPGFFSGNYTPYYYGDTASIAEAAADPNTVAESNEPSPAAQNDLARPYPSAQMTLPVGDSTVNPPDTAPGAQDIQPGNGPDSLVEAVQAELSRRGYFGGKVDAIYNTATHAAIRRFQTDQKLPASGRINEATLHALQLD